MTRNKRLTWSNILMTAASLVFVVVAYLVHVNATDRLEDLAVGQQQIHELFLKHITKSENSAAIHVDREGSVIWLNEKAERLFGLRLGDDIEKIMLPHQRAVHRENFEKAMKLHDAGNRALSDIYCKAYVADGDIVPVHVETWSVPDGAMAYIRVLVDVDPDDGAMISYLADRFSFYKDQIERRGAVSYGAE